MNAIDLAESGLLPDWIIRQGIRARIAGRSREIGRGSLGGPDPVRAFVEQSANGPLAIATDSANAQHYEVPAEFFRYVLGPRLKYSACLFESPQCGLPEAEDAMLRLTCERAEIQNGMRILELGCGWGSLTLWMGQHFPGSEITAVSNSRSQREFIYARAEQLGLENIRVMTADMRDFETDESFDRVVSVEMFEHMRNYRLLFQRVAHWLRDGGKAFAHVFCHRQTPYFYEADGPNNWMARHFFTGGTMPSEGLFAHFDEHLSLRRQWRVNGLHYWKTCEAWLENLDRNRRAVLNALGSDCGPGEAKRRLQRWRMFFMACAELFRFRKGEEWFVAHYLFDKAAVTSANPAGGHTSRVPSPAN